MDEKRIKVTDKRMFTPDGELREEYRDLTDAAGREEGEKAAPATSGSGAPSPSGAEARPAAAASPGEGQRGQAPPPRTPPPGPPADQPSAQEARSTMPPPDLGGPFPPPTFFDLVSLLAQPVALYLGEAQLADGRSAENLEMARLHIDLLAVLEEKTAGNLAPEERQFMEELLYELRMRYVQKRG